MCSGFSRDVQQFLGIYRIYFSEWRTFENELNIGAEMEQFLASCKDPNYYDVAGGNAISTKRWALYYLKGILGISGTSYERQYKKLLSLNKRSSRLRAPKPYAL
jgi:hypothetical protein